MSTLLYLGKADFLAEVDKFWVDEMVQDLLVVTVDPALFHYYPRPHHRLVG